MTRANITEARALGSRDEQHGDGAVRERIADDPCAAGGEILTPAERDEIGVDVAGDGDDVVRGGSDALDDLDVGVPRRAARAIISAIAWELTSAPSCGVRTRVIGVAAHCAGTTTTGLLTRVITSSAA